MAERARVAVIISGRGSNMAALIYAAKAADCPFAISLVLANDPAAAGLALAEAEGIATWSRAHRELSREAFDEGLDAELRAAKVEYVALAGYMRLLSPGFVARWRDRIVNIHPSLLPAHKGLHTHEAALAAGDRVAGCSVHVVTAELDDGPVLAQTEVAILPHDTPETLAARVLIAEHQLYPRTLATYVSRPFDADWIQREIHALASGLPEVVRKTSHGSPGWATGAGKSPKLFAILADHHHGEASVGLLVKASGADEMRGLIEARPNAYYWPKYYGASGWLALKLNRADVDWDEVREWLERSWRSVAPPRLTKLLRAAEEF